MILIRVSKYLKDDNVKYVDILMGDNGDEKRFVDMYTIVHKTTKDEEYKYKDRIIKKVKTYFEEVLKAVREDNDEKLKELAKNIHEAKYTSLGYSTTGPGKGFGDDKFNILVESMKKSEAYQTGIISDILDVELYVENVGVDIISDLVTNLIQDVLAEYTEVKLNQLSMADKIREIKTHYWNEEKRQWSEKNITMLTYSLGVGQKEYNYLLVPENFTADERQKEKIISKLFDNCVYEMYRQKILNNPVKYGKYIHTVKDSKDVYKKAVAECINDEFGGDSAKEGHGYLTAKGILDLVNRYEIVKEFIESEIKK